MNSHSSVLKESTIKKAAKVAKVAKTTRKDAKLIRCAVYTRKSSEEGLEQDFNSLDAQREACEAFILSQKHEGWIALADQYNDGGISGGTLDRPALQRLLKDIKDNKIDAVVVYKVDRLTRSLTDFAKIVETFDDQGVSFISVTQQFNTTTSMGRLTLNVLLSFAQFEREVTGERIRDKIAASKKKGMWMGGPLPLGYDVKDRKLIVNHAEAKTVRHIYQRYLDLGSVRLLMKDLSSDGIISKVRVSKSGIKSGGLPFGRGALYRLLQNRMYLGEIVHKEHAYPGGQDAIVDETLWEQVQSLLNTHRVEHKTGETAKHPSLLAGLLFDDQSERFTPTHAVKKGKRYRYYISNQLNKLSRDEVPQGRRLPAGDIEQLVCNRIHGFLLNESEIFNATDSLCLDISHHNSLINKAKQFAEGLQKLSSLELRKFILNLITRIEVFNDKVIIHLLCQRLHDIFIGDSTELVPAHEMTEDIESITLSIPAQLKRTGMEKKMLVDDVSSHKAKPDANLIKLVVKAFSLKDKFIHNHGEDIKTIAERENLTGSYFTRLIRINFLAPDIIQAILLGAQPATLDATTLLRYSSKLPLDWKEQRAVLGFK